MQRYELDTYLGDTTHTDDQANTLLRIADAIDARWPDPDLSDQRETAFASAVAIVLGDDTLEAAGDAWRRAVAAEVEARAAMTGAIIATSILDPLTTEVGMAETLHTTRPTVRKALGK